MLSDSPPVVSVRVNRNERQLLEMAAQRAHTTLSDFVRRKALEAAEMEVFERRIITIPAEDWEKFEAWAHAPAKNVPALSDLAARRPQWEE